MNKLTNIRDAYAAYDGDDRGYPKGEPLALYPFKGAASYSKEFKNTNGYGVIKKVTIVSFEDLNYIYEKVYLIKEGFVGKIKLGVVEKAFEIITDSRLAYGGRVIKYVVDNLLFLNEVTQSPNESFQIRANVPIISDGEKIYVLNHEKPVKMTPFTLSREMAVQNALDKLTDEEQSLLGLK